LQQRQYSFFNAFLALTALLVCSSIGFRVVAPRAAELSGKTYLSAQVPDRLNDRVPRSRRASIKVDKFSRLHQTNLAAPARVAGFDLESFLPAGEARSSAGHTIPSAIWSARAPPAV
jgi:hypothetical protein